MNFFEQLESRFTSEQPYLEQSQSWREGMRYRYCPERYSITQDQWQHMVRCGELVGQLLEQQYGYSIIEFRLDYVADDNGKLLVTEIQTDDRGLPAIATERNARGQLPQEPFTGIINPFLKALQSLVQKDDPLLLITYPQKEKFYYNGFYDFRELCFAEQLGPQVIIAPQEKISPAPNRNVRLLIAREGLVLNIQPDLVWNFDPNSPITGFPEIQPQVDKSLLERVWSIDTKLSQALRSYIPRTIIPNGVPLAPQDNWILKPISGRWSQGVIIGKKVDQSVWDQQFRRTNGNMVAQEFINPRIDYLWVRTGNNQFGRLPLYSRIEGYYCIGPTGWTLTDILITATSRYPVHGQRESIMTLAQIV